MLRRDFIRTLSAASTLAALPLATREALAGAAGQSDLVIQEIDVLRLVGAHRILRGVNRQPQVQPGHLYPERRPRAYKDATNAKPEIAPLTQFSDRLVRRGR